MHGSCTAPWSLIFSWHSNNIVLILLYPSKQFVFCFALFFFPFAWISWTQSTKGNLLKNSISTGFLCCLYLHDTFTQEWMCSIPSFAKLIQDNSCSAAIWSKTWQRKRWFVFYVRVSGSCCSQMAIQCIWRTNTETDCPNILPQFNVHILLHILMLVWCVKLLQYFWTYWRDVRLSFRSSGGFGPRSNLR